MLEFLESGGFYLSVLFALLVGSAIPILLIVYILDVTQTKHAIRRNYPVVGHLRYFFEFLGKFFRQYFFAMDREEMPFNREQRSWVYRAAKNIDNTVPFGSTRDLRPAGTVTFVNTAFPMLEKDAVEASPLVVGPQCKHPYIARSFFNISAMSYGAISKPAVQALSHGAQMAGCWLNTGEGGLSPYHLEGGCDIIFQIGTAKYGVRTPEGDLDNDKLQDVAAHPQVKMIEIKLSQGAKPGKGGLLPAAKVNKEIADIRGIPANTDSISPNRFPEVDNIDELLDFIAHVRAVAEKPTGIKFVVGDPNWVNDLCAAIKTRGEASAPDFITVDSADGGTGAAPMSLIDYMGMPIRESLSQVVDSIESNGLRDRIKIIASGKLITPGEVAWALCTGADFVNSARGFMFALGCIQALQCNKNTCPTGVTTHKKSLQRGLDPRNKSVRVKQYVDNVVREVGVIAHSCGAAEPRELRREHCRIVTKATQSLTVEELYRASSAS